MAGKTSQAGLYAAAFDAARTAVVIQEGHHLLDCNGAALALFKWPTKQAFLATHPADLSPLTQPDGGDSHAGVDHFIARAMETGFQHFEWMHKDYKGVSFPCDITLQAFAWQGRCLLRATISAIPAQKYARDKAAEIDHVCFRALFDSTDLGILLTDINGAIVDVSAGFERLFQYTHTEIVNRRFADFIPDHLRGEAQTAATLLKEGKTYEKLRGLTGLRMDGSEVHISVLAAPVRVRNGAVAACIVCRNVSEQWNTVETLRQYKAQMRTVLNNLPVILYTLDTKGRFTMSAGQGLEQVGLEPEANIGRTIYEVYPDYKPLHENFERALNGEIIIVRPVFNGVAFETRYAPLKNADGHIIGVAGVAHDISEAHRAHKRLEHLAHHDELTGLPNRTLLHLRVTEAIKRASRNKRQCAVFFMDLDHFKTVNDSLGHDAGDKVLTVVAQRLKTAVRDTDTVARMGGDEFVVLIEDADNIHGVARVAQKLLDALSAIIPVKGVPLYASSSIGISLYPDDGTDVDTLLRNADAAMYVAKEARNTYQFYANKMNDSALQALLLSNRVRAGITRGEFVLYYEPVVDLSNGRIVGFEERVRWQHPERGLLLPDQFLPLAEEMGLITPLGEAIINSACRQLRAWHEQGYTELRIAVRLTSAQFRNTHFMERAVNVMTKLGVAPSAIPFEIPKHEVGNQLEQVRGLRTRLDGLSLALLVDDYGQPRPSEEATRNTPFDYIKVGAEFVDALGTDNAAREAVEWTLKNAVHVAMPTMAEGVDTPAQYRFLKACGCLYAQGALFNEPVPAEVADRLLKEGAFPLPPD